MSGKAGRSGRKPQTAYTEKGKKEMLRLAELSVRVLKQRLEQGDHVVAMYCYDQIFGRAKATTEIKAELDISADRYYELMQKLELEQKEVKLLEMGNEQEDRRD